MKKYKIGSRDSKKVENNWYRYIIVSKYYYILEKLLKKLIIFLKKTQTLKHFRF